MRMTKQRERLIKHMKETGTTVFLSYENERKHYGVTDGYSIGEAVIEGLFREKAFVPAGQSFAGMESQQYKLAPEFGG